jgi:hypothetical protein
MQKILTIFQNLDFGLDKVISYHVVYKSPAKISQIGWRSNEEKLEKGRKTNLVKYTAFGCRFRRVGDMHWRIRFRR